VTSPITVLEAAIW